MRNGPRATRRHEDRWFGRLNLVASACRRLAWPAIGPGLSPGAQRNLGLFGCERRWYPVGVTPATARVPRRPSEHQYGYRTLFPHGKGASGCVSDARNRSSSPSGAVSRAIRGRPSANGQSNPLIALHVLCDGVSRPRAAGRPTRPLVRRWRPPARTGCRLARPAPWSVRWSGSACRSPSPPTAWRGSPRRPAWPGWPAAARA